MPSERQLLDDCFLHDKDRMKHSEVLQVIEDQVGLVVDDEHLALNAAAGRIVAENMAAKFNVPLADNSAVDGYAFAHQAYEENNGRLELAALIAAGDTRKITLESGQCAHIFTGAVMPDGADSVAMQEDCEIGANGKINIPCGLKFGANCRRAGEDIKSGQNAIEIGQRLGPARMAALASIGTQHILVRKKLRVAILSTGDEIIEPGEPIQVGKIYDANRPMLSALLASPLISISDLGVLPDDEAAMSKAIAEASTNHDLILTSGSASRGDEDHMLNVLARLGKRHLWQIAIKPGRPMMFGQIGNAVIVGLPGNPVASMVCANLYVLPLIAKLLGAQSPQPRRFQMPANFEIKKKKTDRREFLRGWTEVDHNGTQRAVKFDRDGSGLITGLRLATGLIEITEEIDHIKRGDQVAFIPFGEFKIGD